MQSIWNVLRLAVWFGLLCGLVEGALASQITTWLHGAVSFWDTHPEIISVTTAFDLLLFTSVGIIIGAAAKLAPRLPAVRFAGWTFVFLTVFDWVGGIERIRHRAILVLAAGVATVFLRWLGNHETAALSFFRHTLPWVSVAAVALSLLIPGGAWWREHRAEAKLAPARPGSPNVLVIVIDTLRADHLSSYGYHRPTSPNLDQIARQGVLFENAVTASSWTVPSHASLLTGSYPHEHGAEKEPLHRRHFTLAEALRLEGYRTGAISANVEYFSRKLGLAQGFLHFEDEFWMAGDIVRRALYAKKFETLVLSKWFKKELGRRKTAEDVNQAALRWVDADRQRPFFLVLNYFDVHDPYTPPQPYSNQFAETRGPERQVAFVEECNPETADQLPSLIRSYDGTIAYVDAQLQGLLTALAQRGLADNTLLIVTSDHGEAFCEHGTTTHRFSLYREEIHVPLLFWWPAKVPAGMRVRQPVSLAGVSATVMELIGVPQNPFPLRSLTQLWKGAGANGAWEYPLAELAQFPFGPIKNAPAYQGAMKSVVSEKWHYIAHEKLGVELYDWANDPRERNNLAKTAAGQAVCREMAKVLERQTGRTATALAGK